MKSVRSLCCIVFLAALMHSCHNEPKVLHHSLEQNTNRNAPLAAILKLITDKPVQVQITINRSLDSLIITPSKEFTTEHKTVVLGLRPDTTNEVVVTLIDKNAMQVVLPPYQITTPPLPEDFPSIKLTKGAIEKIEPGITMFTVFRWINKYEDDPDWGYAIAVDENGEVVWYLKTEYFIDEVRRLKNGNLYFGGKIDGRVFEIDMLGNPINEWYSSGAVIGDVSPESIAVATDVFHHEVRELESGNFLGLGLEVLSLDDFPMEYPPSKKRGKADIASDVIIEFDKKGNTIHKWSVANILDVTRLGPGSLSRSFYEKVYENTYDSVPFDITHSNAIFYDEIEKAALVSSNYQCAIYKIDMKTGELKWILGDPTAWKHPWKDKLLKPLGDFTYPYHQHGLEITPQGTLLLFDNGGSRFIPPNKPMPEDQRYSMAVEYKVNEAAGTVEKLWSYGAQYETFVSPFISDADYLEETGHVLITDGGRIKGENGEDLTFFGGKYWARIFEVTKEQQSRKLWEITIEDPEIGLSVYRAERLKSLYPHLDK